MPHLRPKRLPLILLFQVHPVFANFTMNRRADLGFKGDLTQPVVGSGAGGFSVEEDEHLGPFWSPIALMDNFGELTFIAY